MTWIPPTQTQNLHGTPLLTPQAEHLYRILHDLVLLKLWWELHGTTLVQPSFGKLWRQLHEDNMGSITAEGA